MCLPSSFIRSCLLTFCSSILCIFVGGGLLLSKEKKKKKKWYVVLEYRFVWTSLVCVFRERERERERDRCS